MSAVLSVVNMKFACGQISMPVCSMLFKSGVPSKCPTRAIPLGSINIYSPTTVILLSVSLWLISVLIRRTQRLYSYPARKEFVLFLYMYAGCLLFDLILHIGVVRTSLPLLYTALVALQLSCTVGTFVAALGTGLVWVFPHRASSACMWLSRIMTLASVFVVFCSMMVFIPASFGLGVFAMIYLVPMTFGFAFVITQMAKLRQIRTDVWEYGSLFLIAILTLVVAAAPYGLGMLVVLLSDGYVDGIFLMHTAGFFAVIMAQKLWIIDNEQEIECVNTVAEK